MKASAWRGILAAVVLLGVVAMHHVAESPHRAMRVAPVSAATTTTGAHGTVLVEAPAAWTSRPGLGSLAPTGSGPAGHAALPALCLAVLLAAALVVTSRRSRGIVTPELRMGLSSASSRPAGRGPPRLLLAQLCVLRT